MLIDIELFLDVPICSCDVKDKKLGWCITDTKNFVIYCPNCTTRLITPYDLVKARVSVMQPADSATRSGTIVPARRNPSPGKGERSFLQLMPPVAPDDGAEA